MRYVYLLLFLLPVGLFAQPANDDCADAIAITVQDAMSVTYTAFDTRLATRSMPSPVCTSSSADDDIWYSFTATQDTLYFVYRNFTPTATSSGLGYDIVESCAGTTANCDFSVPPANGANGRQLIPYNGNFATAALTVGQTYLIRIFAQSNLAQATGEFAIVARPDNDECDNPTPLAINAPGSCSFTSVNTSFATRSPRAPQCTGSSANDDIFYSFVADGPTQRLSFENFTLDDFSAGSNGPGFEVLDGCSGASLACEFQVPPDASGASALTLAPSTPFVAGNTYILRLFAQGSTAQASFDVCLETVTCTPPSASATTISFANCPNGSPTLTFNVSDLGSFTELTINNDGGGAPVTVTAVGNYEIGPFTSEGLISFSIDNTTDALCNLDLGSFNIFCRAENNSCADAEAAVVNEPQTNTFTSTTRNYYATNSSFPNDPSCGNYAGGDLWYTFTATTPSVVIDVLSNDWSSVSATIYTNDCNAGTEVACDFIPGTGTGTLEGLTIGETYLLRIYDFNDDNTGFVTFSLQADLSLPATLTSFTATNAGKHNRIDWATATETGVDRFVVERSTTGNGDWATLKSTDASNNAGVETTYSLLDETPAWTTYYRLRTVDLDGTEALSSVVSVTRAEGSAGALLAAYPNPATDRLTVSYELAAAGELTLTDAAGRTVIRRPVAADRSSATLDLTDVTPGLYLLRVANDQVSSTRKVVVR